MRDCEREGDAGVNVHSAGLLGMDGDLPVRVHGLRAQPICARIIDRGRPTGARAVSGSQARVVT